MPAPYPALLVDVPTAAAMLQVSRSKLYLLLQSGELPSLRVGRLRRIRRDALAAFVAAREADSAL